MVSFIIELDKIHKALPMHAAGVSTAAVTASDLISRWKLSNRRIIAVIVYIFLSMSPLSYLQLLAKAPMLPQVFHFRAFCATFPSDSGSTWLC